MKRTHRGESRALIIALASLGLLACPGPAGAPCDVTDNGDGTSTLSCPGGSQVTVKNGTDGTNGKSCSITVNPDAGTKTITCQDGTTVTVNDGSDGTNGTNGTNANDVATWSTLSAAELAAADLSITITSVSNEDHPTATFTVQDQQGRRYKGIPAMFFTGIGLLQLVPGNTADGGNGLAVDTWVSHIANCATCMVGTESPTTAGAKFVDRGDGSYTFTFGKDVRNPTAYDGGVAIAGVAYDANAHHRFGINLRVSATNAVTGANALPDGGSMLVNAIRPVDTVLDYIPATGENVTGQDDKVNTDNCLECHGQLRANANNAGGAMVFHTGQRYITQYCPICHNDQRKYGTAGTKITGNPVLPEPGIDYTTGNMDGGAGKPVYVIHGEVATNFPVWIHKIHMGKKLLLKGTYPGGIFGTELNKIGFPQSPANCTKCHSKAIQADNWMNKPNRRACNACHDRVDFTTGLNHGPIDNQGRYPGGAQLDDSQCVVCHGPNATYSVAKVHVPVALPDPNNALVGGTNANTNAAWLGNDKNPPPGARSFAYDLPAGAVTAVPTADGGVNASVKFRMLEGATPVVFNTSNGTNELIDTFIGGPSVYCAFSLPQDGILQPADFNASVSGYLKTIWNGEAAGTAGAGTMTFDSATGYYTVVLTGVNITTAASHLTCGLGYTYSLTSTVRPALATIPLTQINLPAYPYNSTTKAGGLSVPSPNVWRVATGHTGRRTQTASTPANGAGLIVNNDNCQKCHKALGVAPSFHAGQRNNAASCAFCHTPNRTSNGWASGSPYYIHAIHGTAMRTVPYNWNALSPTEGFYEIRFPGRAQMCETCHNPGYYDFSNVWYTDVNLATRLPQTAAADTNTGLLNRNPVLADGGVNASWYMVSPYVKGDNVESFGKGYAFAAATGVITEAATTTLVHSPTATVCFSCHDAARSVSHMEANGGQIYVPRNKYKPNTEQCLVCHGPGKIAAIKDIHYK